MHAATDDEGFSWEKIQARRLCSFLFKNKNPSGTGPDGLFVSPDRENSVAYGWAAT